MAKDCLIIQNIYVYQSQEAPDFEEVVLNVWALQDSYFRVQQHKERKKFTFKPQNLYFQPECKLHKSQRFHLTQSVLFTIKDFTRATCFDPTGSFSGPYRYVQWSKDQSIEILNKCKIMYIGQRGFVGKRSIIRTSINTYVCVLYTPTQCTLYTHF